jgi:hypothetical protein
VLDKALLSAARLSELGTPKATAVSDLRDWVRDYSSVHTPDYAFLKMEKEIQNDLIAIHEEKDGKSRIFRLVEQLLWRVLAKVCPFICPSTW